MEAGFCVEALKEAIAKYGEPEIMNSDQGSQFIGFEWRRVLNDADVKYPWMAKAAGLTTG